MQHDTFIRQAITLSNQAAANGDHPFGALLVHAGNVLLEAVNTVHSDVDITAHAELSLVRLAWAKIDHNLLANCILYTSTEPCAMCAGGIYWAGIQTVVFGCSAKRLNAIVGGEGGLNLPCAEVFSRGKQPNVTVIGPILEDEAIQPHLAYWKNGGAR